MEFLVEFLAPGNADFNAFDDAQIKALDTHRVALKLCVDEVKQCERF